MFIGVMQTYRNMEKIQDRITRFIADHSNMKRRAHRRTDAGYLPAGEGCRDNAGGEEAVREGLIDETGGIRQAMEKLYELIEKKNNIC